MDIIEITFKELIYGVVLVGIVVSAVAAVAGVIRDRVQKRPRLRHPMPARKSDAYYSRVADAVCRQCLDTRQIIRGSDGQKISCPDCR